MKNILIILLSIFSVYSFGQVPGDSTLAPSSMTRLNDFYTGAWDATGTNTYAITASKVKLKNKKTYNIYFANGNTTSSTVSLNGGSAITFKKWSSGSLVNLASGDISSGQTLSFTYNGTYLILASGGGGAGVNGNTLLTDTVNIDSDLSGNFFPIIFGATTPISQFKVIANNNTGVVGEEPIILSTYTGTSYLSMADNGGIIMYGSGFSTLSSADLSLSASNQIALSSGTNVNLTGGPFNGNNLDISDTGSKFSHTSSPLTIEQATHGSKLMELHTTTTNDDPTVQYYQERAATTNNSLTTIFTVATASNTNYIIKGTVIAKRTGGSSGAAGDGAAYDFIQTYKNVSGTVTQIGTGGITVVGESQAGWDLQVNISTTNLLIQALGATNNNVTWHLAELKVIPIAN